MKLTTLSTAAAAISFASASGLPTPPLPPWYPLEPWQISSLSTSHPYASPYGTNESSLLLTITNPKSIAAAPAPHGSGGGYVVFGATTAHCELHWKEDAQTPYGYSTNSCVSDTSPSSTSFPQWKVTLNELHTDLSAPGDYYLSLSFELTHNATIYGARAFKHMTGGTALEAGENLEGDCDDDGLCAYHLTNGTTPVLFQPTLESCKSACG
ncbi:hypothetical protein GGR50DRAFT_140691 [Xylaria sp. CBS 124048]|nr:hypothetical protein GGR50DRAFT_140691 [Xylaria sp. CBS 124048]